MSRCFEGLHALSPDARQAVIDKQNLTTRMPGVTGNLMNDLTRALGGKPGEGALGMLSNLVKKSSASDSGDDDDDGINSVSTKDEASDLAKSSKELAGQVSD